MKELTIEITNHCSLNCIQCSTMASPKGDVFVKVSDIKKYLKQFKDFDRIRFSGGEPFEHPRLGSILKSVKGRERQVLSCGLIKGRPIPSKKYKDISPYLDELIFSLHGDDSIHDQIVSGDDRYLDLPPYWDYVIDSFDNARINGIKKISFETVAMKKNLKRLEDIAFSIYHLGRSLDYPLEWHILRYVKQGRGKTNEEQALDKTQASQLPKNVKDLAARYKIRITYSNSFEKKKCDCGSRKAAITYDGKIIPCSALKYSKEQGKRFACKNQI